MACTQSCISTPLQKMRLIWSLCGSVTSNVHGWNQTEPCPVTCNCNELARLINNLTAQVNTGFQQCNAKLDACGAEVTELKASGLVSLLCNLNVI